MKLASARGRAFVQYPTSHVRHPTSHVTLWCVERCGVGDSVVGVTCPRRAQVAPPGVGFSVHEIQKRSSKEERAAYIIEMARRAGVVAFEVEPTDIASGQHRLLLAFVAAIYLTFAPKSLSGASFAKGRAKLRRAGSDEREERALLLWMMSIGINIQSLSSDCRSTA